MDPSPDGIRWELYPQVAAVPAARAFVLWLRQFSRQPQTVAAYARNLDRFLTTFAAAPAERWIEADEGDLLAYLDDLRGRPRGRRARPGQVVPLFGDRLAAATIAQHVVALRSSTPTSCAPGCGTIRSTLCRLVGCARGPWLPAAGSCGPEPVCRGLRPPPSGSAWCCTWSRRRRRATAP